MLDVTFYRDGRNRIAGVAARGHANFAPHDADIVCAAVSAILQAAHLGLAEHVAAEVTAAQKAGVLELTVGDRSRGLEGTRAILATAELAIEQIAAQYPKHVRLKRARLSRGIRSAGAQRITAPRTRRSHQDV
jgi:uncharacterized protein YsxB (DUF464 family)